MTNFAAHTRKVPAVTHKMRPRHGGEHRPRHVNTVTAQYGDVEIQPELPKNHTIHRQS